MNPIRWLSRRRSSAVSKPPLIRITLLTWWSRYALRNNRSGLLDHQSLQSIIPFNEVDDEKLLSLLFVLGLALSACRTEQTQSAPPAQTSVPSLVPSATQTSIPPTATVTPLPTIPTFTPTFDVSTIVTVTPAENASCPKIDYTIPFDNGFEKIDICFKLDFGHF